LISYLQYLRGEYLPASERSSNGLRRPWSWQMGQRRRPATNSGGRNYRVNRNPWEAVAGTRQGI